MTRRTQKRARPDSPKLKKLVDPRTATAAQRAEWSLIAIDDTQPAAERLDALEQLAIAEGDFAP